MEKNFSELISYSESGILSKVIVKNDKMNITLFCMAAGTEISGHTSTKEGFVYVVEGDGLFIALLAWAILGEAYHSAAIVLLMAVFCLFTKNKQLDKNNG